MNAAATLARWNATDPQSAAAMILPCCGSGAWSIAMASARPVQDADELFALATRIWLALPQDAWQEAFAAHPRIGESAASTASAQCSAWSAQEQRDVRADHATATALADANAAYEARFRRVFLIRASGRTAEHILAEALRRLENDDATELLEAVDQQQQITTLRLQNWLLEGA